MVTTRCECGPISAPLVGFDKSTVKDSGDLATFSLTIGIAVLFQFQHERNFWGNSWVCIRAGAPIGVLAALPFWLMLRRGAILSPGMTGAATGLLAGLVGTSVLEIHCPNLDAWHILVSHLGAAMLCALAGLVIGLAAEVNVYAADSPFKREPQGDIE